MKKPLESFEKSSDVIELLVGKGDEQVCGHREREKQGDQVHAGLLAPWLVPCDTWRGPYGFRSTGLTWTR